MNPSLKLLQKIETAFDFNEDTLSRVRHVAVEFQFGRQTVNKRTKADSLHGTAHDHLQSFASGRVSVADSSLRRARRARPTDMLSRADNRFHMPNQKVCSRTRFDRREKVQS